MLNRKYTVTLGVAESSELAVLKDILEHVAEVLLPVALFLDVTVVVDGHLGHVGVRVAVLGSLQSQSQVLLDQSNLESTVVVARSGGSLLDAGHGVHRVHNEGAGGGDLADFDEFLGVHAELLTDGKALGGGDHVDAQDQVVAELGNLTSAGSTAVEEVGAHATENVLGVLELIGLTTNHEGKSALLRTHNATGHGGVKENEVALGSLSVELLGGVGSNGGDIANVGALLGRVEDTILHSEDALDVLGLGQSSHDKVRVLDGILYRVGEGDTSLLASLALLFSNVVALDLETVLLQVLGHGETHVAQTDEADLLAGDVCGRERPSEHPEIGRAHV